MRSVRTHRAAEADNDRIGELHLRQRIEGGLKDGTRKEMVPASSGAHRASSSIQIGGSSPRGTGARTVPLRR